MFPCYSVLQKSEMSQVTGKLEVKMQTRTRVDRQVTESYKSFGQKLFCYLSEVPVANILVKLISVSTHNRPQE